MSVDSHVFRACYYLAIAAKSLDINNIIIILMIFIVIKFQRPLLEAPPSPPPHPLFNATALAYIFQKLNTFLFKFEGSSTQH